MKSILKLYKNYTDAIHGFQKMEAKYSKAEMDITRMTITFGCVRKVRFNFIGNLEGMYEQGYDEIRYDPEIEDDIIKEFSVLVKDDEE